MTDPSSPPPDTPDPGRKLGLADAYAVETPDDNRALYRDWAATYESEFTDARGYVYHEGVARVFVEACGGAPQGRVLDVGCGTGVVGVALAALGCDRIDGIDLSPEMLAEAAKKQVYGELFEADLTQRVAIDDHTYAGVTSVGTFTHGHLGPEPIRELVRIVAPGGVLAIGINAEHFESLGFAELFDRLVGDGAIEPPSFEQVRIYQAADDQWADDLATVAVLRLPG